MDSACKAQYLPLSSPKIDDEQVTGSTGQKIKLSDSGKAQGKGCIQWYTVVYIKKFNIQVQKISTGDRRAVLGCIHLVYSPIYKKMGRNTCRIQPYTFDVYTDLSVEREAATGPKGPNYFLFLSIILIVFTFVYFTSNLLFDLV
uniref:Uncharacterized protein n=1 Tax=Solanum tuberosum TaxID=4113 RepID=M1AUK6_SOLTU